ncbi:MAG: hypothetical protein KDK91_07965 [Gammaproteobacteria bacterium]|nr:hypothetical protein [Gammaproteobacteria bacterium]
MTDQASKPAGSARLTELAFAYKNSNTLLTAIDLDLFTHIAAGADRLGPLADRVGMDAEIVDRIVTVCKALDLVEELDGRLRNREDVDRYLVRTEKGFLGDYFRTSARRDYATWADLTGHLDGSVADVADHVDYKLLMADPARARQFTELGYKGAIGLAYRLTRVFDFARHRRWLDFAGGSGVYSIAACERNPDLRATVMDQPNVIAVAREYIAAKGLSERIDVATGDFLIGDDYPPGHDLISFITPLQGYMPDAVIQVFGNAFAALEPGGEILVIDYMLENDKTGPLDPALVSLFSVRGGRPRGRVNTGTEFRRFLHEAGFEQIDTRWFTPHQLGLVTARKPGP